MTAKSTTPALPDYSIPSVNRKRTAVGIDTETTGLYSPKTNPVTGKRFKDPDGRYCYPYLVCAVYYNEPTKSRRPPTRVELTWEFRVDPATRQLEPFDKSELQSLKEIYELVTNLDFLLVGHNISFDLGMIYSLFTLVPLSYRTKHFPKMSHQLIYDILLYRADDTTTMYHAIDSDQHLELKPLATRWAGIPDSDERDLKLAVDAARKAIQQSNLPIKIASLETIPYLTKAPTRGWYILDAWLGHLDEAKLLALPESLQPLLHSIRELAVSYCVMDCWRTLSLHREALLTFQSPPSNHPDILPQYELNRTALFSTYYLSTVGVPIHLRYLDSHLASLHQHQCTLVTTITKIARRHLLPPRDPKKPWEYGTAKATFKFNPGSDAQLAELIHDKLEVPCTKFTESGKPSMKIDNMIDLLSLPDLHPDAKLLIQSVIALRKYSKAYQMESTYHMKQIGGRLYASYNPNGTGTLRLSSYDPNGQNIGKGQVNKSIADLITESVSLRPIFGPSEGREWVSVDYVQLQLVIFAIVTGDPEMRRAVDEQRDIHDFMARKIFNTENPTEGERRIAKAVNFGYIFGAGERKVEATAKIKGLFDLLRMLFPTATNTIGHNKRIAERDGYVRTHGGYPLKVPREKPHAATNYVIQGTEGEIVKFALYCCIRYLLEYAPQSFLTITVHDELVFDFPKGEAILHMRNLIQYMILAGSRLDPPIPLRVDAKYVDSNKGWNTGTPVEF
ncbi:DNA-directed DNA polymerase, family A, palm domain containing protein [uncultured Caudovirales phage]|uniref:DNA-directed DNA polymerase, family A, palm domain containing protein n=1 Tax=uncultured Caudovirales phage TaxID=2100421 RepID=A0A6J5MBT4_9CAUD|nr:DNA-directed DNA polymerase, family A, palm domain containing protein [uncultured Caudovirales phage]